MISRLIPQERYNLDLNCIWDLCNIYLRDHYFFVGSLIWTKTSVILHKMYLLTVIWWNPLIFFTTYMLNKKKYNVSSDGYNLVIIVFFNIINN